MSAIYIEQELKSFTRIGPLFHPVSAEMKHTKDPCPVYDGKKWHIFGTGYHDEHGVWHLVHAVSLNLQGPWEELPSINLGHISGHCVAAPGVIFDNDQSLFHMFIQTTCFGLGGKIVHLISEDGNNFIQADISLESIPNSFESGIYDSHPAVIDGQKYLVYSAMSVVGQPDISLARSQTNTWSGPWERMGRMLKHEDIHHHNQHGHDDYEWGLEGAQLCQLPDGSILLNAVCFLPEGERGTRQRIFLAHADTIDRPFRTLGPVLQPSSDGWECGENGHGSLLVQDDMLYLFYQAKSKLIHDQWRFGLAYVPLAQFNAWLRNFNSLKNNLE